jgi:hypothetical protein
MKQLKLVLLMALACLMGCTPKIKNDNSIGEPETKTYTFLMDKLTKDMKREFGGNMYESEKITPVEIDGVTRIGIPNGTTYSFVKDNSKFIKGDINNDKKFDLIISADMSEGQGLDTKEYFVFMQGKEGYEYFGEFKASDIVKDNCSKADLLLGLFNLDSISGGLLIGNTNYRGTHESYYKDYSYRCETEKYKLNVATKEVDLVSQSDLLKKNSQTGKYEKVETK